MIRGGDNTKREKSKVTFKIDKIGRIQVLYAGRYRFMFDPAKWICELKVVINKGEVTSYGLYVRKPHNQLGMGIIWLD